VRQSAKHSLKVVARVAQFVPRDDAKIRARDDVVEKRKMAAIKAERY
jgi:hypothetical protein